MTEPCDDYDGYKKETNTGYVYKCGKVEWASEIEMRDNLKCYDNAHSKAKCITETYRKQIEEDLDTYMESTRKPLCQDIESVLTDCLKREDSLFDCNREINEFKECLDNTVHEIYERECENNKSA